MGKPFLRRRFKSFVALLLFLIFITATAIVYLVTVETVSPKYIDITNLTDSGVTITWYTDEPSEGIVYVREKSEGTWSKLPVLSKRGLEAFHDDRDMVQNNEGMYVLKESGSQERRTHHVTVRALKPETEYQFRIASGLGTTDKDAFDNKLVSFTTPTVTEELRLPDPAYGNVKYPDDSLPKEAIVKMVVKDKDGAIKSQVISNYISEKATWSLDVNTLKDVALQKYLEINEETDIEQFTVMNENGSSLTYDINPQYDKPADQFIVEREIVKTSYSSLIPTVSAGNKCHGWAEDESFHCNSQSDCLMYQCVDGQWQHYAQYGNCFEREDCVKKNQGQTQGQTQPAAQTQEQSSSKKCAPGYLYFHNVGCIAADRCRSGEPGSNSACGLSWGAYKNDAYCWCGEKSATETPASDTGQSSSQPPSTGSSQTGSNSPPLDDGSGNVVPETGSASTPSQSINSPVNMCKVEESGIYLPLNLLICHEGTLRIVKNTSLSDTGELICNPLDLSEVVVTDRRYECKDRREFNMPSMLPESRQCEWKECNQRAYIGRLYYNNGSPTELIRIRDADGDGQCEEDRSNLANTNGPACNPFSDSPLPDQGYNPEPKDSVVSVASTQVLGDSDAKLEVGESGFYKIYTDDTFEQSISEVAVNLEGSQKAEIRLFIDANANGIKDADEEYFIDYTQLQIKKESEVATYNLNLGWSLIAFPVISNQSIDTASKLIDHFNEQGADIKHIARYTDSGFQMYTKREGDIEYSNDFNIIPGQGYFVLNYQVATVNLQGNRFDEPVPFRVSNGWNLVGVYTNEKQYTAENLLKDIKSKGITADTVSKYDSSLYTNVVYEGDILFGNDFNLLEKQGYFIRVISGGGNDVRFTPNP